MFGPLSFVGQARGWQGHMRRPGVGPDGRTLSWDPPGLERREISRPAVLLLGARASRRTLPH